MGALVLGERLEEVVRAVRVDRVAGLLSADRGLRQVALREPRRQLVAPDRVDGREPHVHLAPALAHGGHHAASRDLGLEDRRHGLRVVGQLAAAVVELGRVQPGQLDHADMNVRALVAELRA